MSLDTKLKEFIDLRKRPLENNTGSIIAYSVLTTTGSLRAAELLMEGQYVGGIAMAGVSAGLALATYLRYKDVSSKVDLGIEQNQKMREKPFTEEEKRSYIQSIIQELNTKK
ncbi:hypothetical protein J4479_01325 [Candidatus Woesearchaeota archaeon]|nr:hypothetical protein [Candidatus Woesearchaeota archaeon]